jgi:hypothetical protein
MEPAEARRAVRAAMSVATSLSLDVDDAVVLNDSNRLVVRLLPCDTVARVAPIGWYSAAAEVEVARCLMDVTGAPIGPLDPRVEPRVHERDGFEIAMWTYFEPVHAGELTPAADYAHELERLHDALRQVDMRAPHFTDRLRDICRWLADPDLTPVLTDEDRRLLADRISNPGPLALDGGAAEQLLHGEPHAWNVLATQGGPLFIDFENCARGPVEYDLAWVPKEVSDRYRGVDQDLIVEYRGVVLALIAAHHCRADDHHPSGTEGGMAFLDAVRGGPPWPDKVSW